MFQRTRLWQQLCAGHESKVRGKRNVWEQERWNVKNCEVNEEGEQDRENNHKNKSTVANIKHRIVSD